MKYKKMIPNELYYSLYDFINKRVNVMTRSTNTGKMIVIYDDHRWILNVLYKLYLYEIYPDLVYLDAHDDAAKCKKNQNY